MDCTVLHWAVLGCAGLYWSVLVCTRLNWAVVGCSRLYCGVLGCTGRIQQLFVCVFSQFWLGDKKPNNQPSDPRASLLLTSEKAVFCNYKSEARRREQTGQVPKWTKAAISGGKNSRLPPFSLYYILPPIDSIVSRIDGTRVGKEFFIKSHSRRAAALGDDVH